jgi:hypothetical protein
MMKVLALGFAATDLTATALSMSHASGLEGGGLSGTLAVLTAASLVVSLWGAISLLPWLGGWGPAQHLAEDLENRAVPAALRARLSGFHDTGFVRR